MSGYKTIRMQTGKLRILLPEGVGTVEIITGLATDEGKPRVRVDVLSDTDRFGPADNGLNYVVKNGEPGPGVVFLTGSVSRETVKGT